MTTHAVKGRDNGRWWLYIGVIGAVAAIAGFAVDPHRTWASWLHGALLPLTIAAGAAAFTAINRVSNAGWATTLRRIPEAMIAWIPIGGIILLIGAIGGIHLFGGGGGHAPHGAEHGIRTAWLEPTFLIARLVAIIALWSWLGWRIRTASYRQDRDGDTRWTGIARNRSALFLVVFAITFTAASFDWIMSLDHGFYSTIFAFYVFTGAYVSGIAAVTVFTIFLSRQGIIPAPTDDQLHSLGKLLLAFTTFWAYLWFCQYMLIYYANIPEETSYYLKRTTGGWEWPFWGNLILGWLVPFVLLLSRRIKMNRSYMMGVALLILATHWLDLYVMVIPATGAAPLPSWTDIAFTLLFIPLALGVTMRTFKAHPPTPLKDPYACEVGG